MDAAPPNEQVRKVASPLLESENVMARKDCRPAATSEQMLTPLVDHYPKTVNRKNQPGSEKLLIEIGALPRI